VPTSVSCFRVLLLSIDGVMLCVLVDVMNKPIGIFFTSLCSAMSFICGDVMVGGCGDDMGSDSDAYSEGRPIGSLVWLGPRCDYVGIHIPLTCSIRSARDGKFSVLSMP